MPEGDAVRRTADRLDRALAGRRLTASDLRWPSLATVDLSGASVIRTATHGKHLFTRLEHDGEPLTLHTHLKMEGSWRVFAPGRRWDRPGHTARVVLTTDRAQAVGFALGLVELLPSPAEARILAPLGPDLLDPRIDLAAAVERLRREPDRPLGEALLDQRVVAGLGTIYVSEACFAHGAHPRSAVGAVPAPDRLLARAGRMLAAGVAASRPLTTGDRRDPLWVYRRQRRPCRRCGTTVAAGDVGPPGRRRTLYWCPHCQPLPG